MNSKLSKYLQATLQDKPTKLFLHDGTKETKDFLLVIGGESPRLKRALAVYGYDINRATKDLKDVKMSVDKVMQTTTIKEDTERNLAVAMVTGWSFGDLDANDLTDLLTQNKGLVDSIHARSFDTGKYTAKK